uniref:glycosyltransferase n=1 Tax=uncultured Clostridium sp. TaxID=59620 RepID=UPI002593127E
VSETRNIGIMESKGEFIVFVDSDDWIDKDMIENMYKFMINEKPDMVICTYTREFEDHSKERKFNLPQINIYENEQVKNDLFRKLVGPLGSELSNPEYLDALGTVWGKMYKANILKENFLKFIDLNEIGTGEDILFNIYVFNYISKAILLNIPMYHYWRGNEESITSKYIPDFINKRKKYFNYMKDFINENKLGDDFIKALNNRICTSVLGTGLVECYKDNNISEINKVNRIKNLLNDEYIDSAYKGLELRYFPIHWRFFYFFNKYKLAIPSYLMLKSIGTLKKII